MLRLEHAQLLVGNNAGYEYKNAATDILPSNEVQVYTWPDATLKEIGDLVKGIVTKNIIRI